jgi:hypothetical protein
MFFKKQQALYKTTILQHKNKSSDTELNSPK